MKRWILSVVALAVLGGVSACGGGTTAQIGSTQALLAPGYLATSAQEVDFIQWTRQGNSFSGSFNAVYVSGSPPSETTQSSQGTASGSIDGSRVSVNVNGPAPNFGNLSSGTLIINFPQRDGTLRATMFRPGTADDYNQAVFVLKNQVSSANAAEVQREEAAAQAQQQQQSPPTPPTTPSTPQGTVTGPSGRLYAVTQGVIIRDSATSSGRAIGSIPAGAMVGVQCKVTGETITGPWGADPYWNRVTFNGVTGFVTDQWIDTKQDEADPSKVPTC